jgi:hypothetical protein
MKVLRAAGSSAVGAWWVGGRMLRIVVPAGLVEGEEGCLVEEEEVVVAAATAEARKL